MVHVYSWKTSFDPVKLPLWIAEFFGTLHFPTSNYVTPSLWVAEFLELVSFVAHKQVEFLQSELAEGFRLLRASDWARKEPPSTT